MGPADAAQKKGGSAPPAAAVEVPTWDWLALADDLWPGHGLAGLRWQDLPSSTRFDLRKAHTERNPEP
jgi:hypothetical protein